MCELSKGFSVSYKWHNFNFFTRWRAPNIHQTLCFDVEPEFESEIIQTLNSRTFSEQDDGYMPHSLLTSVVIKNFDASVWSLRDWIRYIEQNRMKDTKSPETDYPLLHELARHAFHSSETISVATNTLDQMSLHHKSLQFHGQKVGRRHNLGAQPDLDFQISLLHGIHARSVACENV